MTHDIDRKRIEDTGERARRVIADLEYLAVAGATQHEKQLDLLKAELERVCSRLAIAESTIAAKPDEPPAVDMTVGLDDVRAILADSEGIAAVLVVEDGAIQVIDSLHAVIGYVDSLADGLVEQRAQHAAAVAKLQQGAADDTAATAQFHADELAGLTRSVRDLAVAIRPLNTDAANMAATCNIGAAIDTVTEAITELAGQLLTGEGNTLLQHLVATRESCGNLLATLGAIDTACTAAGMPFCEPEQIAPWLAANLKPKTKRAKVQAAAPEQEGPFVVMRNDANGRRFWADDPRGINSGWNLLPHAMQYDTVEVATASKPRSSKVVTLLEAQRLVDNDARIAAASQPSLPATEVLDG